MAKLLQRFLDNFKTCEGMPPNHEGATHLASENIWGDVHSKWIESLQLMMRSMQKMAFQNLFATHLIRYVQEWPAYYHRLCEMGTIDCLVDVSKGGDGKRLRYEALIADNGVLGAVPP
ncbi:MAG: hypothetical protein F4213_20420 [Boseongicola sp. SB0677_bin_26]|nr:hypothetical protein [Boseongicola sp. SB0665_bin_10]MYG28350.1 hypothetical protein [Boseongicola sp. SB0677_bin_26]